MSGIKRIGGRSADNRAGAATRKLPPQSRHASSMRFRCHEDDDGSILAQDLRGNSSDFLRRVVDLRFENMNRSRGNTFVGQNARVEKVLAGIWNPHRIERGSGLFGMR